MPEKTAKSEDSTRRSLTFEEKRLVLHVFEALKDEHSRSSEVETRHYLKRTADYCGVSSGTVKRLRAYKEKHGCAPPRSSHGNRTKHKRKVAFSLMESVRQFIRRQRLDGVPTAHADVANFLKKQHGVDVHIHTVQKMLRDAGLQSDRVLVGGTVRLSVTESAQLVCDRAPVLRQLMESFMDPHGGASNLVFIGTLPISCTAGAIRDHGDVDSVHLFHAVSSCGPLPSSSALRAGDRWLCGSLCQDCTAGTVPTDDADGDCCDGECATSATVSSVVTWFTTFVLPHLEAGSVLVLERNDVFHDPNRAEGIMHQLHSSSNEQLADWLAAHNSHNANVSANSLRVELVSAVRSVCANMQAEIESCAAVHGHQVLWVPSFHDHLLAHAYVWPKLRERLASHLGQAEHGGTSLTSLYAAFLSHLSNIQTSTWKSCVSRALQSASDTYKEDVVLYDTMYEFSPDDSWITPAEAAHSSAVTVSTDLADICAPNVSGLDD